KNASQYTITDVHIRRTDGKKFDHNSSGGKAFPNAPTFSNGDTEVEFSGGNIPPGSSFWMKVPEAPQPDDHGGGTLYTGYLPPHHAQSASYIVPEPKHQVYVARALDCQLRYNAASRVIEFEAAAVVLGGAAERPSMLITSVPVLGRSET